MMNKSRTIIAIVLIAVVGVATGYTYQLSVRLDLLEQRVDLLTKSQPSNQTSLSALEDAFLMLKRQLSGFNGTLAKIVNHTETLQNRFSSLSTEVSDIRESLQGISGSHRARVAELYDAVKNSVVSIRVTTQVGPFLRGGVGSGFVYDSSGTIITNNHVVEGATAIEVVFIDGSSSKASVVGSDPYSDLAVLRLKELPKELKPLSLGDSSSLGVGDPIVAIGNPFGLSGSLTTGVVSQTGRTLSAVGGYMIPNVIQIDAAINPGNSGGPLLNLKGEVVGITTAIQSTTGTFSGVGFAIPSDTVRREVPSLIDKGGYDHPWLGVRGTDMTSEIAELMNTDTTRGWLITEVVEGGPADKAGLKGGTRQAELTGEIIVIGGDIILKIGNSPIRNGDDISAYLEEKTRPGQSIILLVERNGVRQEISVTLGVRPPPA